MKGSILVAALLAAASAVHADTVAAANPNPEARSHTNVDLKFKADTWYHKELPGLGEVFIGGIGIPSGQPALDPWKATTVCFQLTKRATQRHAILMHQYNGDRPLDVTTCKNCQRGSIEAGQIRCATFTGNIELRRAGDGRGLRQWVLTKIHDQFDAFHPERGNAIGFVEPCTGNENCARLQRMVCKPEGSDCAWYRLK